MAPDFEAEGARFSVLRNGRKALLVFTPLLIVLPESAASDLGARGWVWLKFRSGSDVARRYLGTAASRSAVVLVDESGTVRHIATLQDSGDLLRITAAYDSGKQSFHFACARCHGSDGGDGTYAGIKTLRGIGRRLTRDQIAERLNSIPTGANEVLVRGHVLSRQDFDALVLYVSGL
jgi:hypothetical protein